MKYKVIILCLLFYGVYNVETYAQVFVQNIPNNNLTAYDVTMQQNGYKLAYDNFTSEDYLFKGNENLWKEKWVELMTELNSFIKSKNLNWTNDVVCYNRVYFSKEGKIEGYLYDISGISESEKSKFDSCLKEFVMTHGVTIPATMAYWQYGNITFKK